MILSHKAAKWFPTCGVVMQDKIGGIAHISGQSFAFPTDMGFGLVESDGRTCLVRFSCQSESFPPQGAGHILTSTDTTFTLEDGVLKYGDEPVVLGRPLNG